MYTCKQLSTLTYVFISLGYISRSGIGSLYWAFLSAQTSACDAGDTASIPGWGRSPGEGNGYPLQYSCLENFMDRGAWQATVLGVHGVSKSWTRLSD